MPRPYLGLLRRRECLLPTALGWLAIILLAALSGVVVIRGAYPFLATQNSVPGGVLVAEGWVPDYALEECLAEFHRHHYDGIFVTGIPMEAGGFLSQYKSFADLSTATLLQLGAEPQLVHSVPAPEIRQDRTYGMAVALREKLRDRGVRVEKLNIISVGVHARRTRMLYEKVFGPATQVGIIAVPHRDFEPARWWHSSQGFRMVTGEMIAYVYTCCFFHPAS